MALAIGGGITFGGGISISPESGAPSDPYFADVSALLHGDGTNGSQTILDSSGNPITLTASGNAQINTATKKYGTGSIQFDGTGDWVSSNNGATVAFPGDFTMELWFYPTTTTRGMLISSRQLSADLDSFSFQWVFSKIYFGNTSSDFLISATTLSLNTWTFVAVTRASGTLRLFLNGNVSATTPGNSTNFADGGSFRIGAEPYNNSYPLTGFIDDLRITKGVARYTENFTPPTAAFPDQ